MHSSLRCVWAVMMTLAVFLCLFPQFALCHLGSAVRAGADGKHPMLNHIRVSREPQVRHTYGDDYELGNPTFQSNRIKSPSYQHKILQFHSNGQTSSGQDYYPTKLIVNEFPSVSRSLPAYPVPSKYGKDRTRYFVQSTPGNASPDNNEDEVSSDGNDSWETYGYKWVPNLLPKSKDPTFTPYISSRTFNIPEFKEYLQENIKAILAARDSNAKSEASPSRKTEVVGKGEDVDKYVDTEEDMEKIATPTRRGYPSISEPTVAQSLYQTTREGVRGDLTNRDSRSARSSFVLASRFLNPKPIMSPGWNGDDTDDEDENNNRNTLDEKTEELLHFLGHGKPEYPKANKYNPSWLFTNLGLGKRSGLN